MFRPEVRIERRIQLILARFFHVIDHEHVDYGSLRLHVKAEFLEYVEQGRAVGIIDGGIAALRSGIQAAASSAPSLRSGCRRNQ